MLHCNMQCHALFASPQIRLKMLHVHNSDIVFSWNISLSLSKTYPFYPGQIRELYTSTHPLFKFMFSLTPQSINIIPHNLIQGLYWSPPSWSFVHVPKPSQMKFLIFIFYWSYPCVSSCVLIHNSDLNSNYPSHHAHLSHRKCLNALRKCLNG